MIAELKGHCPIIHSKNPARLPIRYANWLPLKALQPQTFTDTQQLSSTMGNNAGFNRSIKHIKQILDVASLPVSCPPSTHVVLHDISYHCHLVQFKHTDLGFAIYTLDPSNTAKLDEWSPGTARCCSNPSTLGLPCIKRQRRCVWSSKTPRTSPLADRPRMSLRKLQNSMKASAGASSLLLLPIIATARV